MTFTNFTLAQHSEHALFEGDEPSRLAIRIPTTQVGTGEFLPFMNIQRAIVTANHLLYYSSGIHVELSSAASTHTTRR